MKGGMLSTHDLESSDEAGIGLPEASKVITSQADIELLQGSGSDQAVIKGISESIPHAKGGDWSTGSGSQLFKGAAITQRTSRGEEEIGTWGDQELRVVSFIDPSENIAKKDVGDPFLVEKDGASKKGSFRELGANRAGFHK